MKTAAAKKYDVIIVGGGPSGLALCAILGSHGVKTACIDLEVPAKQTAADFDGRTIAISFGSRAVLKKAGVWNEIVSDACPIDTIQISDGDSPVLLEFDSEEVGGRTFGWIAEMRNIRKALFAAIAKEKNCTHIAPVKVTGYETKENHVDVFLDNGQSLQAALVIGADGRNSFTRDAMGIATRGWSYKQRAIVCTVIHEFPHGNIAIENFRPEGPFAVLPMTDDEKGNHRSSIVWTEHGREKDSMARAPQDVFDAALNARFPDFYGQVRQIEKRYSFPLGLVHAHSYIAPRMALIADAGHGIHPIAGQGLNMGYRDVAALAGLVIDAKEKGADTGSDELLELYQRARRFDNVAMAGTTDILNKLFSNGLPPVAFTRRAGLRMVSKLPFAKRFFMKQAMGASGLLPDMIRESEAA